MSLTSIKVKVSTHAKLIYLKTRYDALEGKQHTWEEFLETIAKDVLLVLAAKYSKKNPDMSYDSILAFITGQYFGAEWMSNVLEMYSEEMDKIVEATRKQ